MQNRLTMRSSFFGTGAALVALLAGCSGSTEDVRVTLCKNLSSTLAGGETIEWTNNENVFHRPSHAITNLTFYVVERDGTKQSMRSGCHYAYEALDDTALNLANPLDAYETLPFAMSFNGSNLSDGELLALVNSEQKRLGREAVATLQKNAAEAAMKIEQGAKDAAVKIEQGARDMAEKVRAGIGQ